MTIDPLLSAREAMAFLGCSRTFLTEHAAELGGVKVGSHLKFTRAGLDAYVARQTVKAPEIVAVATTAQPKRPRLSVVGRGPTNPLDGKAWDAPVTPPARARGEGR